MKTFRLLLLGLALFSWVSPSIAQWTPITLPSAQTFQTYDVQDIEFVDRTTGYIAATVDTINPSNGRPGFVIGGVLLKTTDGGQTWNIIWELRDSLGFSDIALIDENNYALLSGREWASKHSLFITSDGGQNWTDVMPNVQAVMPPRNPGENPMVFRNIHNIQYTPNGDLHLAGRANPGDNSVHMRSTDTGSTFTMVNTNAAGGNQVFPGNRCSAMLFVNDTLGYFTQNGFGDLMKTVNGGGAIVKIGGRVFNSDAWGLAADTSGMNVLQLGDPGGGGNSNNGIITYSTNGGQTINRVLDDVNGVRMPRAMDAEYLTSNVIIAASGGGLNRGAYKSEDAGASWTQMQFPTAVNGNNNTVEFVDENFGFTGGEDMQFFKYSGFAISAVNVQKPSCGGSTFDIAYEMTSDFNVPANTSFSVELSDQSGSFANPTIMGSFTGSTLSDTLRGVTIPVTVSAGLYKMRLKATGITPSDTSLAIDFQVGLDAPSVNIQATGSGNGNFLCAANDSLTLTAPGGFTDYIWSNGLQGANLNTIKIAGGQSVYLTVQLGTCSSLPSDTVTAVFAPNITGATQAKATTSCGASDGEATFNPNQPSNPQILWGSSTGNQSGPTATNLGAGQYTVTVTDGATGCSKTFTVTVPDGGAPQNKFSSSLPTNYCTNASSLSLSADSAATTFSGPGVTGSTFDPATAGTGTHDLIATLVSGSCTSFDTLSVTVNAVPAQPTVTVGSKSFITSTTSGLTFTWLQNGNVVNTGDTLTASPGTYQVVANNGNCDSDTLTFTVASIEGILGQGAWSIYPNPNTGTFQLELPKELLGQLAILDLSGKVLLSEELQGGNTTRTINTQLQAGVYLLQLRTNEGVASKRLVIQ